MGNIRYTNRHKHVVHIAVDDEDLERLSQWKWKVGWEGYAYGWVVEDGVEFRVKMSRYLLGLHHSSYPGVVHHDGDLLNNHKSNLSLQYVKGMGQGNMMGIVHWGGKWRAFVTIKDVSFDLGLYVDVDDAILARKRGLALRKDVHALGMGGSGCRTWDSYVEWIRARVASEVIGDGEV